MHREAATSAAYIASLSSTGNIYKKGVYMIPDHNEPAKNNYENASFPRQSDIAN